MTQKYYLCHNKNKNIVKKSSSGGMFFTVAEYCFSNNKKMKVYGCILDKDLNAVHIGIDKLDDIYPLLGSKYIQSDLANSFYDVKNDLENGYSVLFSGTPCQVAALNSYLKSRSISTENLLTVDFVCHGVGNNAFFKDYIKDLEKKYKSAAVACSFRTKNKPGKLQDMSVTFENGKKYIASTTKYDWFYSAYLQNLIIKQSCYKCPFAKLERLSDFTLADAWGIKSENCDSPSLVICNTQNAINLFENIKNNIDYRELNLNEIKNPQLFENITKPEKYDEFNKIYQENGYYQAQKFIGNNTIKTKLKVKIINFLYKFNIDKLMKIF